MENNPLDALQKAMYLGIGLFALFIAGAGVAYLLLTLLDIWEFEARLIISLILGPILTMLGLGFYWLSRKSKQAP